ncbi:MAG: cation:proton antiporter [Gammaproteobacteria bacterium]|nr:cation:proton antiporter [Gammaproteobacteria bacterium]MDH3370798.1 cation:proton antiporter [Gammaproteobacteria bacterium]MDH3563612.1 cation:proton antiporter [Gammaproteobacteria bacterium]MDH5488000.1 cation:proton antiporter [Gammaproteobacteria bacterium]
MEHHVTLVLALVGLLGFGAQWLAWRIHLPAIVLLVLFGLLAGPVTGWIRPSQDLGVMLDPIIKIAVAVILFEGGLRLRFHELKTAATGVVRLVTLGVLLSFPLGSLAAHYIGGLSWPVALVFGAIVIVTGPTVIIPLLRQARLRRRPASYLKWEGIVNDPTGALLAVVIFEYFVYSGTGAALPIMIGRLSTALALAGLLGVGCGFLLGVLFRRGLVPEYLKGPGALAAAIGVYVAANQVLSESGLLAATLLGITLGNMNLPSIDEMRRFKEYIALVLVSGVFILLTAELDPSILLNLDWRSFALLGAVIFVLRPVCIFFSTIGAGMSWQERALLAWIAPRGIVAAAVAAVFGPALLAQGYPGAELLLPLVFTLILVTVVAHGFSMGWLSRTLDLSAQSTNGVLIIGASPWTISFAQALNEKEIPVMIVDSVWHRLRAARLAGIKVYYGQILSEASEEKLEFNDYGYLLAATDNDAYNALVCKHFAAEMGRNHVFQLPDTSVEEPDPQRLSRTMRGLIMPAERAWYEELMSNWYHGWTFQKTLLTDEFTDERFQETIPTGSLTVAVIKADKSIQLYSPELSIKPKPGDTVVWFGPKPEKAKPSDKPIKQA